MRIQLLLFILYCSYANGFGLKFRFNSGPNLQSYLPKLQIPAVALPLLTTVDLGAGTILTPPPSNNMGLVHSHMGGSNNILVNFVAAANHTVSCRLANITADMPRIPHINSSNLFTHMRIILNFILRTALLLLPFLAQHVSTVLTTLPLLLERVAQYINPSLTALVTWSLLQTPQSSQWMYSTFLASTGIGLLFLCYDQLLCGERWAGLGKPAEDAVAVITGAQAGLGRQLAHRLSAAGYGIVLVDNDLQQLQELRHALLQEDGDQSIHPGQSSEARPLWNEGAKQALSLQRSAINRVMDKIGSLLKENSSSTEPVPTSASAGTAKQAWRAWPVSAPEDADRSSHEGDTQNKNMFRIPYNNFNVLRESALRPGTLTSHEALNITRTETPAPRPAVAAVHIVQTDLTHSGAAHGILQELQRLNVDDKVEVLVHTAQHRVVGMVSSLNAADLTEIVQGTVLSAVTLTRLLLPQMINRCHSSAAPRQPAANRITTDASPFPAAVPSSIGAGNRLQRGGGRILFLSAECERTPAPSTAVFAASAAFLSSFAQSLRRELFSQGVLVTVAHTGALRSGKEPILPIPTASAPFSLAPLRSDSDWGDGVGHTDHILPPTNIGADGVLRGRRQDPLPARLPVIARIPGSRMHVEDAAQQVFAALNTGRDAITLGILNKFHRHGLTNLLPAPALAILHQLAWCPVPQWHLPTALPRPHLPRLSLLLPRIPAPPRSSSEPNDCCA